jgi:hypothetical protein
MGIALLLYIVIIRYVLQNPGIGSVYINQDHMTLAGIKIR